MTDPVRRVIPRGLLDAVPILLISLIAGLLRLVHLGGTGLRIDEGFTLMVARQPWPDVLGLHGHYDLHPPLFFAAAKAANIVFSEAVAARTVSAVAGTLTIPVVYLLGRRLIDGRVGLAAATLLAVSPLHVELSRDGRMYAPVVLLVAATWLAALLTLHAPGPRWAITYAMLLTAGLYTDYSAGFGIAPQIILVGWWAWRDWRRARWLAAALFVAGIAYLPWLPQLDQSIDSAGEWTRRSDWLDASWANVTASLRSLAGLDGRTMAGRSDYSDVWSRWPWLHFAWVIVAAVAVLLGVVVLRRRPTAMAVALASAVGTVFAAIVLNRISPGFAPRTVAASLVGGALVVSAFATREPHSTWLRRTGLVAWVSLLTIACLSLPATYEPGSRAEWPRITADLVAQRGLGKPIIVFSSAGMVTDLIDLYAGDGLDTSRFITVVDGSQELRMGFDRWLDRGPSLSDVRAGALARMLPVSDPSVDAVWVILRFGGSPVLDELRLLGYRRVGTFRYVDTTTLLYARPVAHLGETLPVDPSFSLNASLGTIWVLPSSGTYSRIPTNGRGVTELVVARDDVSAELHFPVVTGGLVTVETQVLAREDEASLVITCRSSNGASLLRRGFEVGRIPPSAGWEVLRVTERCPFDTAQVTISFVRHGDHEVAFRNVAVQFSPDIPT